jgi:hypothetical protein
MVLRECGICQSSIYPDESTTICPTCGLTFHAECWKENWGCAAYGCEQVNILKPKEEQPQQQQEVFHAPIDQSIERLPWNFVLLGVSAVAGAVSTITYGVPSFLAMTAIAWRIWTIRGTQQRVLTQSILLAASMLAVVGFIAGILISNYWYS